MLYSAVVSGKTDVQPKITNASPTPTIAEHQYIRSRGNFVERIDEGIGSPMTPKLPLSVAGASVVHSSVFFSKKILQLGDMVPEESANDRTKTSSIL